MKNTNQEQLRKHDIVVPYLEKVLNMMDQAHIVLPKTAKVSVYHHVGISQIDRIGATFINIVNRDYCKSYVIMLPGQVYPHHYHRVKTESFYVLYGILGISVDNDLHYLRPGEMIHIDSGQDHTFWGKGGVIFEEISTRYEKNDSIYLQEKIQKSSYSERRTVINTKDWKEIYQKWKM